MALQYPKGKFISIVKVGDKGQIVIPKGARELFGIQPGDQLLLMADKKRGIALIDEKQHLRTGAAVGNGAGGGQ